MITDDIKILSDIYFELLKKNDNNSVLNLIGLTDYLVESLNKNKEMYIDYIKKNMPDSHYSLLDLNKRITKITERKQILNFKVLNELSDKDIENMTVLKVEEFQKIGKKDLYDKYLEDVLNSKIKIESIGDVKY